MDVQILSALVAVAAATVASTTLTVKSSSCTRPTRDTWDIPGGYVERGESPASACRREVLEELALDREPLRLAAVDWAPNDREGDKLLFVFDCGPLGEDEQRIELDGQELDRWEWVAPGELGDYLIPRLARRIGSLLKGDAPAGAYFEHGVPFPSSALV